MENISLTKSLEAKARALLAINCAKHKAAGRTHRIQIRLYGAKNYLKTIVFYTSTDDPDGWAMRKARELGSRTVSDYEVRAL